MTSSPHVLINAHLLSGGSSYRRAGIHNYIYNTLSRLGEAAPGTRFTALTGPDAPDLPPSITQRRSRWNTARPARRILWEQAALPGILRRERPDLFHGMAFSLPFNWSGPSIVTLYDLSFRHFPERLSRARRAYLNAITISAARRARRILTISESTRQDIHRMLGVPLDRIDVAYPGVDVAYRPLPDDQVAAFRAGQGLPERFILHVGTLEPRKNLETLIRAYHAIKPFIEGVGLVFVGGAGWQTGSIFALIEQLGLREEVRLAGYVPLEDLPLWYNAATVFAYPSVYEGFGIPPVEAMRCGTPVIVSDAASLPEAVGDGGKLLPPLDVAAWGEGLKTLLANEAERTALAARGQDYAARFTWEETTSVTVAAYHKVLDEKA
jgi:glycosyltransferase involved in cell wall biosynthesis